MKPGDTVKVNDVVVEIETAKSLVELPVPFAGTIGELLVGEGDTVEVGTPIITVDDGKDAAPGAAPAAPARQEPAEVAAPEAPGAAGGGCQGGGCQGGRRDGGPDRRPRRLRGQADRGHATSAEAAGRGWSRTDGGVSSVHAESARRPPADPSPAARSPGETVRALAKPPVRKLAKDLGVDLGSVTPTGDGGIVTRADVEAAASGATSGTADPTPAPAARAAGGETRIPVKGVRKMTAQAMVDSAFTAPHVTEWVTVDVTRDDGARRAAQAATASSATSRSRRSSSSRRPCASRSAGTPTSTPAGTRPPRRSSSSTTSTSASPPRPRAVCVVPNVKGADTMTLRELADAIAALTATAREGRTPPADMAGGTITITNVGVFGIDAGTPILNPGEAAILAFGSVTRRPWVVGTGADERIEPRWVTTLALSFDHRLVDGELGSRYLADVAVDPRPTPSRGLVWG